MQNNTIFHSYILFGNIRANYDFIFPISNLVQYLNMRHMLENKIKCDLS